MQIQILLFTDLATKKMRISSNAVVEASQVKGIDPGVVIICEGQSE